MLRELIDQFYQDSFEERERSYFYVSDVGKCPRALYFHFKNAPREKPDPRVLRVFDQGDYIHMRLMSVLFGLGIVRAVEIRMPPNDLIHGRADAIISLDNKPYVVELKSSAGFKFRRMNEPQADHVKQIQLYMHYFEVPRGILLYENKDTQELKDFLVEYEADLTEELISNFQFLREQIEKDIIPEIPENIEAWRCRYCEYRTGCQRWENSKLKSRKPSEHKAKTMVFVSERTRDK